jgi:hypothetical protein
MKYTDQAREFIKKQNPEFIPLFWPDPNSKMEITMLPHTFASVDANGEPIDDLETSLIETHAVNVRSAEANRETTIHANGVKGVTITGWEFEKKQSVILGMDFDANDHSQGLTNEQIAIVKEKLASDQRITSYTSKGGRGRHGWIKLSSPVPTENFQEHKKLGRYVLQQLAREWNMPELIEYVDVIAGNMFLYHADKKPEGYSDLKCATASFDVPADWRQHVKESTQTNPSIGQHVASNNLDWLHQKLVAEYARLGGCFLHDSKHDSFKIHVGTFIKALHNLGWCKNLETKSGNLRPSEPNGYVFAQPHGNWQLWHFADFVEPTWKESPKNHQFYIWVRVTEPPSELAIWWKPGDASRQVDDPIRLAKLFHRQYLYGGQTASLIINGYPYLWEPATGCWTRLELSDLKARLRTVIDREFDAHYERMKDYYIEQIQLNPTPALQKKLDELQRKKTSVSVVENVFQSLNNAFDQEFTDRVKDCRSPCWLWGGDKLPDPNFCIPFKNGILDLKKYKPGVPQYEYMLPLSPQFFCSWNLGYDFDPAAPQPVNFQRLLDTQFGDDAELKKAMIEFIGLAMTPLTKYQRLWGITGPSSAGKGTLVRAITSTIGPRNTYTPEHQDIDKYTAFGCQDKNVLLYPEIDFAAMAREALSRWFNFATRVSGEDAIALRDMNRIQASGKLPSKILFVSMAEPVFPDVHGALKRRLILFKVSQQFLRGTDHAPDPNLSEKLDAERSGIALVAIQHLLKVLEVDELTIPESSRELVEKIQLESTPIVAFVQHYCDIGPRLKCKGSDLRLGYTTIYQRNGDDFDSAKFGRDIKSVMATHPQSGFHSKRCGGKNETYYFGIDLKPKFRETIEPMLKAG